MKRLLALLSILVVMTLALLGCGSGNGNTSGKWYGIVKFPQGGIVEGVVGSYMVSSSGVIHLSINGVSYIVGLNNFILVRNDFLEEDR